MAAFWAFSARETVVILITAVFFFAFGALHSMLSEDVGSPPQLRSASSSPVIHTLSSGNNESLGNPLGQHLHKVNVSLWRDTHRDDFMVLTNAGPYTPTRFVYSILTTHTFHGSRLQKVMSTWGKHVNVGFITTDRVDPAFPKTVVLGEGERDLGGKTLQAFAKFCDFDSDFYVLIDDDAFIVAPNLERGVASMFSPHDPLYGGYTLTHTPVPFVGGGGGIVVSNATMKLLCERIRRPIPSPCQWKASRSLPGDVAVSMCMQSLKIPATHIDGFSPFPMSQMVDASKRGWCKITWWIPQHLKCNPPFSTAMTMHYVPLEEFDELYYLTYQLHATDGNGG